MLFLIVGCPGSWWSNLKGHCNCNWKRPCQETSWNQFDPYQPRRIQLGEKPFQENGLCSTYGYDRESRNIRRSAKGSWNDLFTFDRFDYGEQQNTKVNGDKSRPSLIKICLRLQKNTGTQRNLKCLSCWISR